MHEILTLQLGQRSNYLATHFWNAQESYFTYSPDQESLVDHDIHFRQGIGADGAETFTPRTLIYDLKGGFGSMRKINALYEVEEPAVPQGLWNGPTVVQRQDPIQQNEYQRSLQEGIEPAHLTPESVKYWSDFNKIYFHPKSVIQLNEYELNSSLTPFDNWSAGEELFNSLDKEHDLLDRDLRYFAEEADQMQGIQIMAAVDDAWGGFAARYLDRIRDEYGKASVLFWGLEENVTAIPREKRFMKLSNTARSISDISPQSSIFVPISMPSASLPQYVRLSQQSQWQISGLLSVAMESIALPSRLKIHNSNRATLDQLANSINVNGNQTIAKLSLSIDQKSTTNGHHLPVLPHEQASDGDLRIPSRENQDADLSFKDVDDIKDLDMDFFPTESGQELRGRRNKRFHVFGQTKISRTTEDVKQSDTFGEDEGFERARRRAVGLPIIQKATVPIPFPLLDSFPDIFSRTSQSPMPLEVSTSVSTDTAVASRVKSLQHIVNRAIGIDEREALSNSLGQIAEAYEDGWDSGTDEDDD
ncbi:Tubulin nucleotide-binding protein [Venustampulla echinocandica]|uniref:Tubulin nucleotide-binding protein n=1 Tax=Venustampulla echinocandica TaxID=2656787 RepID=A0A370TYS9_9HELO|nr:Tubulin nucleotide-binding protein [Venustampulla echinocandica]RDL40682.1 Tubulin nucleotide-binding protein [Venustampulla echinocandica]